MGDFADGFQRFCMALTRPIAESMTRLRCVRLAPTRMFLKFVLVFLHALRGGHVLGSYGGMVRADHPVFSCVAVLVWRGPADGSATMLDQLDTEVRRSDRPYGGNPLPLSTVKFASLEGRVGVVVSIGSSSKIGAVVCSLCHLFATKCA